MPDAKHEDAAAIYLKITQIGKAALALNSDRFSIEPAYRKALADRISDYETWKNMRAYDKYIQWRKVRTETHALDLFSFARWNASVLYDRMKARDFAMNRFAELSAGIAVLNNMSEKFREKHKETWRLGVTNDDLSIVTEGL